MVTEHERAFAETMRGQWPNAERRGGRVYDPGTRRWYREGYAPFQVPDFLRAECAVCGGDLYIFRGGAAICRRCTYGEGG